MPAKTPPTTDRRVTLSISVPQSVAVMVDEQVAKQGGTASAFIREAITLRLSALAKQEHKK